MAGSEVDFTFATKLMWALPNRIVIKIKRLAHDCSNKVEASFRNRNRYRPRKTEHTPLPVVWNFLTALKQHDESALMANDYITLIGAQLYEPAIVSATTPPSHFSMFEIPLRRYAK